MITYKLLVLICMIFCHIVDDYYNQGILANMKQKKWWEENAPEDMYKHDYIAALIAHAFSWSFMICLPAFIYLILTGHSIVLMLVWFVADFIIHAIVDNMKANRLEINLIQDQSIHVVQIFFTWLQVLLVD